jgi:hypothetical protein
MSEAARELSHPNAARDIAAMAAKISDQFPVVSGQ